MADAMDFPATDSPATGTAPGTDPGAGDRLAIGLVRLAAALAAVAGPDRKPVPYTLAEQQILLVLGSREGTCSLAELAVRLGMGQSATLSALSGLREVGLVTVVPKPSYRPSEVSVSLSEAGRDLPPVLVNWAGHLLSELESQPVPEQRRLLGVVVEQIAALQRKSHIPVTGMCMTCRFFRPYQHLGEPEPHHCELVDAAFGHRQLRVVCPEQQPVIPPPSN